MQVDPRDAGIGTTPAEMRVDRVRAVTPDELRMFGLSRMAYVRGLRMEDGAPDYVIYGADGITVAVVNEPQLAGELAGMLGLMLVTVH